MAYPQHGGGYAYFGRLVILPIKTRGGKKALLRFPWACGDIETAKRERPKQLGGVAEDGRSGGVDRHVLTISGFRSEPP